jgi:murein DD-endopeptidase MepM/ murein hydrolase activator NlpD
MGFALGASFTLIFSACTTSSGGYRRPSFIENKPLMAEENDENLLQEPLKIQLEEKAPELKMTKSFFDWPVDQAKLTRGFLPNKKKPHLGIDLAGPKGTPILAAHDGVVIYTGRGFKGYGKMLMIEGKDGWATLYAHFSKILVSEGDTVKQGQLIGEMGRTGRATGTHLHFEVRNLRGPVDPLHYLPNGAIVAKLVEQRKRN